MVLAEFESPLPHKTYTLKPVPVAGFIFSREIRAIFVPQVSQYRQPKLKTKGKYWYIEYWYRIPFALREMYDNKEWLRFRVKEDINRRQGENRKQYAEWLLSEVIDSLKHGHNPFDIEKEFIEEEQSDVTIPDEMSANNALLLFLEKWNERGLDPRSYDKYKRYVNRLLTWLQQKKMLHGDVKKITVEHIESFLSSNKKLLNHSNREYNNTYDFIRTAFNFLLKKKIIDESPCVGIDKLKAKTTKHRYFDKDSMQKIQTTLLAVDPYLYFACQVTYYACIRSDKELMHFKVGNINFEENKILITAGKGNRDRYIPLDENLRKLFIERGIDKADPSFYVFGIKGQPSKEPFGRGFFSKRFSKVRKKAGLSNDFTVYGFKFTRVVHLKHDGLDDASIMALTGHLDFTSYAKYLRNLGIEASPEKINKVSRRI